MSYVCIFVFVFAHVLCLSLQPVASQGGHLEAVAVLDQRTPCLGEDMPYLLVSILYFLVMFIFCIHFFGPALPLVSFQNLSVSVYLFS